MMVRRSPSSSSSYANARPYFASNFGNPSSSVSGVTSLNQNVMYSFTRFFPAQIPSSRASSSVRQSISLISMAEGNVMKPNFSPYASHSTNFRSARLTSVFTLVSPCSARCRRRSSASFSIRTDLVTLAFPGMNRPCLMRPSTSFFVFLDVLLHSPRWSATHANPSKPVQNIRLLTLADPLPGAEKEDGIRDCQGRQGPSAKGPVVSTAVPSAALRPTHSDHRVGSDRSCESGRRRDLRGFPTSHQRTRAGWAPGSRRLTDTKYCGPAPGPQ